VKPEIGTAAAVGTLAAIGVVVLIAVFVYVVPKGLKQDTDR